MGTPFRSADVRAALLKYTMFRALDAATSRLNAVESCIRRKPMIVPSRSATAITMRALEPRGNRIAARRICCRFGVIQNLFHVRRAQATERPARRRNQVALGRLPLTVCRREKITSRPRYGPCGKTGGARRPIYEGQR